ncbi:MAG: hypothetical protein L0Z62_04725 [Gemmataceae bacterium]|nr:hypothetical protein [Gemmataceae bacterium]
MNLWRAAALLGVLGLVAAPLAFPLLDLLQHPHCLAVVADGLPLLSNTLLLVGGTLAVALPLGVAGAVLLYRTDLPGRGVLRVLILLALFVPLPVLTSAWQAALGASGWLRLPSWSDAPGRPWASGLAPAIWIHAMAAVPWVVLIVGLALRSVEGELEEDALLAAGPWRVLWRVTLPRCRAAVAAAALWVGLQTAAEITVADHMQVRTFAEEVYYEFWQGGPERLACSTAVALPAVVVLTLLLLWALPRLGRALPPLQAPPVPARPFALGRARGIGLAGAWLLVFVLLGVPVGTLVWRLGLHGHPPAWSAGRAWGFLVQAGFAHTGTLGLSVLLALVTGALAAGGALVLCWLALGARWFGATVLALTALLWAFPGPVIGIGLKEVIRVVVDVNPHSPLADLLYYGPSPAPVLWAHLLRYLPCAVAVVWPVLRLLPLELRDSARLDGLGPARELGHLAWPFAGRAALGAGLVIAALSLGEVSAVAINVETPGWGTFAHHLWREMHSGVQNYVAALCLLLLGSVALTAGLVAVIWKGTCGGRSG